MKDFTQRQDNHSSLHHFYTFKCEETMITLVSSTAEVDLVLIETGLGPKSNSRQPSL